LRLKILKKLRTASLNSELTGSYKKSVDKYCYVTGTDYKNVIVYN